MNSFVVGSLLAFVISKSELVDYGSEAQMKKEARGYYTVAVPEDTLTPFEKKQRIDDGEAAAAAPDDEHGDASRPMFPLNPDSATQLRLDLD